MEKINIGSNKLKIIDVVNVARFGAKVELSDEAIKNINASRKVVENIINSGKVVMV